MKKVSVFFLVMIVAVVAAAQDGTLNKYGLWVINKAKQLQKTVLENPAKQMIDIKNDIPDVVLDLRYAGTNNFMHKKLYPEISTTYLRRPAADSLKVIQQQLNQSGFGLKIFDAYRPYAVTEKMWEPVQDDRYAADPKKGSGHNRGVAVDLTIINLTTKDEALNKLSNNWVVSNISNTGLSFQNLKDPSGSWLQITSL